MRLSDFDFELPDDLIARHPLAERRGSRLLCLDGPSGSIAHRQFVDLLGYLRPGDLMVFNNTRVIPARLFGRKATGGALEVLVERVLDEYRVLAHIRSSKSPKPGSRILLDGDAEAEMVARHDALFELRFAEPVLPLLHAVGGFLKPRPGRGSVHHLAFRAANDADQAAMTAQLSGEHGREVTEQKDRKYFRSVYFREPGHVLFEIATDAPGFAVDEPVDALGASLMLPDQYEPLRERIEATLPEL